MGDTLTLMVEIEFSEAAPDPDEVESAVERTLVSHLGGWDIENVDAELARMQEE